MIDHPDKDGTQHLTVRERQVLQLLAEGNTLKEAAAVLSVSPRTVEFHRNNIANKTGFHSLAELSRHAVGLGLVPQRP
jgi:DNA-binding CsgD family transcriptional regulator